MFNKETLIVTNWAVKNWLTSDYGLRQSRWIINNEVLRDKTYILPNLCVVVDDFLRDEFKYVNDQLTRSLIDCVWLPVVQKSMQESINDQF